LHGLGFKNDHGMFAMKIKVRTALLTMKLRMWNGRIWILIWSHSMKTGVGSERAAMMITVKF